MNEEQKELEQKNTAVGKNRPEDEEITSVDLDSDEVKLIVFLVKVMPVKISRKNKKEAGKPKRRKSVKNFIKKKKAR
jgi:hypothetical protein